MPIAALERTRRSYLLRSVSAAPTLEGASLLGAASPMITAVGVGLFRLRESAVAHRIERSLEEDWPTGPVAYGGRFDGRLVGATTVEAISGLACPTLRVWHAGWFGRGYG